MKTSYTALLFMSLLVFGNCSRKAILTGDNDRNHKLQSRQLEMDYPADASGLSASAQSEDIIVAEQKSRFETTQVTVEKESTSEVAMKSMTKSNTNTIEKKSFGNKLLNKILAKKIEKAMKKHDGVLATHEATGRLRTGIILGAVGLTLLVVAQFFGAASSVVYVAGAVLFVVGIVFILLETL